MAITMSSTTESVESMQAVLEGRAPGAKPADDPPNAGDPSADDPDPNAGDGGDGEDGEDGADAGAQSAAAAGAADQTQDEGDPEEADQEDSERPETEHGRRSQRRIKQLNRELAAERRNSRSLAQRLERLERTVLAPPAAPTPKTGADGTPEPEVDPIEALGPRPKQEDYATFEEFLDARDEWVLKRANIEADKRAAKKIEERTAQARQAVDQEEDAAATAALFEQIDQVKQGYSNWDEVMESGKDLPLQPEMFDVIKASPIGAHVLYHLNRNPQICVGIANIKNPAVRAFEMGRFAQSVENWLATQGKPKGAPATPAAGAGNKPAAKPKAAAPVGKAGRKAPPNPPPASVQGRPGSGVKNSSNPADFKAWEAKRNAELGLG